MKKTKLITSICVPAAALSLAGGLTGMFIALNKNKGNDPITPVPSKDQCAIKFNAGDARVEGKANQVVKKGTTLGKVVQPKVTNYNPNKVFSGWTTKDGKLVNDVTKITTNTELFASYVNANELGYSTVTFTTTDSAVVIQGNTKVSVPDTYKFYQINRPTATKAGYVFKWWSNSGDDSQFAETSLLSSPVTLHPVFTTAVTVTYDPNGGTYVSGSTVVTTATGSTFADTNPPTFTNGNLYLEGWYTQGGERVSESFVINQSLTVYAHWSSDVSDLVTKIHFVTEDSIPEGSNVGTIQLDGVNNPTYAAGLPINTPFKNALWNEINRPRLTAVKDTSGTPVDITNNWCISGWKYKYQTSTSPETWSTEWTDLSDTATEAPFTDAMKVVKIRPVLTKSGDKVYLTSDASKLTVGSKTTIYAYTTGGNNGMPVDQAIAQANWTLTDSSTTPVTIPSTVAKLTAGTGATANQATLEILTSIDSAIYTLPLQIKASNPCAVNPTSQNTITVDVKEVYDESTECWVYTKWTPASGPQETTESWKHVSFYDLCYAQTMTFTRRDGTTFTQARSSFNAEIWVGGNCTTIYQGFLNGCTSFNSPIHFINDKVTDIQEGFMEGCTSFNSNITLPSKLTTIGGSFMASCTAFNKNVVIPKTVTSIGSSFMHDCTAFGSTASPGVLSFEADSTLATIDEYFLFNCTSFNQDLTIPSTVTSIGTYFMNCCDAYTGKLSMAEATANGLTYSSHNLSAAESGKAISETGFSLGGTGAGIIAAAYPSVADATASVYRKINLTNTDVDMTKTTHEFMVYQPQFASKNPGETVTFTTTNGGVETGYHLPSATITTNNTGTGRIKLLEITSNASTLVEGTHYTVAEDSSTHKLTITFIGNAAVVTVKFKVLIITPCDGGYFGATEVPNT